MLALIRHFANFLYLILPPTQLFGLRHILLRMSGIGIPSSARFCGRGWIYGRGKVVIGSETWLSPGVIIHTHADADIVIGDRCDIGHGVEFIPGGHEIGDHSRRAGHGTAYPITVGDGCWIGAKSVILGGVTIGAGSVVAAGSLVRRDVPPNTLVAGVPAHIKRTLPI